MEGYNCFRSWLRTLVTEGAWAGRPFHSHRGELMFPRDWIEAIELNLSFCERLDPEQGATRLIRVIHQHGGKFLKLNRREVEPHPLEDLVDLFVPIEHPLLQPDTMTDPKGGKGQASLSFVPESLSVGISQDVSFPDLSQVDPVARGLLAFGRRLYPDLRPIYRWIDEPSGNIPETSEIASTRLRYIFWANFWGPAYVERYGRDFLRGAPGWRVEDLEDGGILYVTTASYVEWWLMARLEHLDPERPRLRKWLLERRGPLAVQRATLLGYFRTRIPDIELYWARVELD
jgi:hypothetical protein